MRTHVPTVRLSVLISLFAFFSLQSNAQSISTRNGKVELGLGIGPMFFLGDLGGSAGIGKTFIKDLDFPLTKLNKGFYLNSILLNLSVSVLQEILVSWKEMMRKHRQRWCRNGSPGKKPSLQIEDK
ncbi:MAG: hypothetical protein IPH89_00265 [Bacteroidetes bacterium]|nr:hypothetical protein [Bacteroidota bacterium]